MNTTLLTDASRLAYTATHEAQGPSSREARSQGWSRPDEHDLSRGTNQPGTSGSTGLLELEGGKKRVTVRRQYMTRSSLQKGYVFARETERGKVHVIRYRVRKKLLCIEPKI